MRGLNQYEYEYKNGKSNYLYINKITTGLLGCIIYINPFFLPFTIHKELYRLEIIALNFFVLVFFIPKDGKSTTQIAGSCPQKFIATVTNIEDVEAGSFPKVEVSFLVIQNLYGDQISSKKIKVVKDVSCCWNERTQ